MRMTRADKAAFEAQEKCEHCGIDFEDVEEKKRDHCHISGAYRACLCHKCNIKAQQMVTIPVVVHNCSGFDSHFFLRGLTRVQNHPQWKNVTPMTIERGSDVNLQSDQKEDHSTPLKNWK